MNPPRGKSSSRKSESHNSPMVNQSLKSRLMATSNERGMFGDFTDSTWFNCATWYTKCERGRSFDFYSQQLSLVCVWVNLFNFLPMQSWFVWYPVVSIDCGSMCPARGACGFPTYWAEQWSVWPQDGCLNWEDLPMLHRLVARYIWLPCFWAFEDLRFWLVDLVEVHIRYHCQEFRILQVFNRG